MSWCGHASRLGLLVSIFVIGSLAVWPGETARAATIQIVNLDPAGVGFNDPTPAAAAPNNSGQTVGEQKLAVLQWAANRLGQLLYSAVPIVVEVSHDESLFCDANTAALAAAGPAWLVRRQSLIADHPDLPTWYPAALAQRLLGTTLFQQDVTGVVNPNLGASDCLDGFAWYYGLDGDPPAGTVAFVDTLLHELTHGLGFAALADSSGQISALDPTAISPYFAYAYDTNAAKFWWQMTAQERAASATGGLLVWAGPHTTLAAGSLLSAGTDGSNHPFLYAPASFAEGSSLSHFDPAATPNLLMEPFVSSDLDVFGDDIDLGLEFLHDMGWRDAGCGNGILEDSEECDLGTANVVSGTSEDDCTTACAWFVPDDCPADPLKLEAGICGCGVADTDSDSDSTPDCDDDCPMDGSKITAGECGCGTPDTDTDADSIPDCVDDCPLTTGVAPTGCAPTPADPDAGDASATDAALDAQPDTDASATDAILDAQADADAAAIDVIRDAQADANDVDARGDDAGNAPEVSTDHHNSNTTTEAQSSGDPTAAPDSSDGATTATSATENTSDATSSSATSSAATTTNATTTAATSSATTTTGATRSPATTTNATTTAATSSATTTSSTTSSAATTTNATTTSATSSAATATNPTTNSTTNAAATASNTTSDGPTSDEAMSTASGDSEAAATDRDVYSRSDDGTLVGDDLHDAGNAADGGPSDAAAPITNVGQSSEMGSMIALEPDRGQAVDASDSLDTDGPRTTHDGTAPVDGGNRHHDAGTVDDAVSQDNCQCTTPGGTNRGRFVHSSLMTLIVAGVTMARRRKLLGFAKHLN